MNLNIEDKYYVPTIEEFKQGFKFEVKTTVKGEKDFGWVLLDCANIRDNVVHWIENKEDVWEEREVTWDRKPSGEFKTLCLGDTTYHYKECLWDFQEPSYLKDYLKDGRIRAKK